ncbi:hypothetical protein ACNKHQ_12375 [Shigella flexneri]
MFITRDVSALDKMFVINSEGKAIPSHVAKWAANAPLSVNHQGCRRHRLVSFTRRPGHRPSERCASTRTMTQLGVPSTARLICRHRAAVPADNELAGDPDHCSVL